MNHISIVSPCFTYLCSLQQTRFVFYNALHPRKLTWNLKMMVFHRNLLFQGFIFRFHVSFRGCTRKRSMFCILKDRFKKVFQPPTCSRCTSATSCHLGKCQSGGRLHFTKLAIHFHEEPHFQMPCRVHNSLQKYSRHLRYDGVCMNHIYPILSHHFAVKGTWPPFLTS